MISGVVARLILGICFWKAHILRHAGLRVAVDADVKRLYPPHGGLAGVFPRSAVVAFRRAAKAAAPTGVGRTASWATQNALGTIVAVDVINARRYYPR
jgi:hypothetical protein